MRSLEQAINNPMIFEEYMGSAEHAPEKSDICINPLQQQILEDLAAGYTQTEIAKMKGISRETLKYYISKPEGRAKPLFEAFSVHSDTELVAQAYKYGFLRVDPTLNLDFYDFLDREEKFAFEMRTSLQAIGFTREDVASVMGISESTLGHAWNRIYKKSPIRTVCHAITYRLALIAAEHAIDENVDDVA